MTCTVRPITVTDHRAPARPTTYVVSRDAGVLPEGIGLGRGDTFYVTSSGTARSTAATCGTGT